MVRADLNTTLQPNSAPFTRRCSQAVSFNSDRGRIRIHKTRGGKWLGDWICGNVFHVIGKEFGAIGMTLGRSNHQRWPRMTVHSGNIHSCFDLELNKPMVANRAGSVQNGAVGSSLTLGLDAPFLIILFFLVYYSSGVS